MKTNGELKTSAESITARIIIAILDRCTELGINGSELCRRAGVSTSHWSEIRNLKKSPGLEIIAKLAAAVDIELNFTFVDR